MSDFIILGRKVKPFAFASMFATAAMLLGPVFDAPGQVFDFDSAPAIIMVIAAFTTSMLFVIAWWRNSAVLTQSAYLLTAGVFAGRAMLGFIETGFTHPAPWISFAWVIAAGGAYIAERGWDDKQQNRPRPTPAN